MFLNNLLLAFDDSDPERTQLLSLHLLMMDNSCFKNYSTALLSSEIMDTLFTHLQKFPFSP